MLEPVRRNKRSLHSEKRVLHNEAKIDLDVNAYGKNKARYNLALSSDF